MSNASMISIQGVSKHYGSFQALEQVDLDVAQGEFVVLLGASGCGKSTLLNLITGFDHPTSGRIVVNGRPVNKVDPNCGMVFQQYALFPADGARERRLRPEDEGRAQGQAHEVAQRFVEMVGLKGFEDRFPSALSAACASVCRSPGCWPTTPTSSCWTSPSRRSTR